MVTVKEMLTRTAPIQAVQALAQIEAYLCQMIEAGQGETFYEDRMCVHLKDLDADIDETSEYVIKSALKEAGWVSISFFGTNNVEFYFPSH